MLSHVILADALEDSRYVGRLFARGVEGLAMSSRFEKERGTGRNNGVWACRVVD